MLISIQIDDLAPTEGPPTPSSTLHHSDATILQPGFTVVVAQFLAHLDRSGSVHYNPTDTIVVHLPRSHTPNQHMPRHC